MIVLEGTLESITYRNDKNSYTVARLLTEDGMMTIVGYFSYQPIGAQMKVSGDIVYHDKYGEQFQVKRLLSSDTNYSNSMEAYLKSGAVAHIGPVLADRIIKKFGDDTYDIFKENPERLLEVEGIGKKTYEKIMDSFNDQIDLRDVMIELANLGISTELGHKLFSKYGDGVLEIIKKNPYKLTEGNIGIGFKTADQIAMDSGVKENDVNRIEAALVYNLNRSVDEGNIYLPLEELIMKTSNYLKLNPEEIRRGIDQFATNRKISLQNFGGELRAYISDYFFNENYIALKLSELNNKDRTQRDLIDIDFRIKNVEDLDNIKFGEKQKLAIKTAFQKRVLIITGGPGTGKTTTLKSILRIAEEIGISYALAAPTGRAAKRMEEATGKEAKTIHRLLEYQFNGEYMEFNRNSENPLEQDMIILDEMSMVDTTLFADLLKAVKDDVRIIMLGDINQIPPVGAGNVLEDLIRSKEFAIVELDTIFRQKEDSFIISNAHLINNGYMPICNKGNSDFFYIKSENEINTVNTIKELVTKRLPNYYGIDSLKDIQVLAPMKRGVSGIDNLNYEIQNSINPPDFSKGEIVHRNNVFRLGDKVMQTKNNYQVQWKAYTEDRIVFDTGEGVYNGDIGFITEVDTFENTLVVSFDEKEVEYNEDNLDELTLAYAITIHKSQGSEFPAVIIPLHYAPDILANRNLIYTGVTRARQLVVLVGKAARLDRMIKNDYITKRYTSLSEKVREFNYKLL